jgi:hypothetical protein
MKIQVTISLWNREEDGSYQAEKDDWKLHVQWVPEPPKGGPFGYSWKAEKEGTSHASSELVEEPEMAMMLAEHAAAGIKHPEP